MDASVKTGSTRSPRSVLLAVVEERSLRDEHVLMLVEFHGDESAGKTVQRECETIMKHALLETDGDSAERLDGALKELNGLLKGMLVSGTIDDLHMVLAVLEPSGMLHVSHAGRGEAYLVRKGLASQVTEYVTGKSTPAFVHISSGALQRGDIVLLSTQRLLRSLTPAQLAGLQKKGEPIDALMRALDAEGEHAALATIWVDANVADADVEAEPRSSRVPARRRAAATGGILVSYAGQVLRFVQSLPIGDLANRLRPKREPAGIRGHVSAATVAVREWFLSLMADLRNPKRKKRAHLLLLALCIALLIIVWLVVNVLLFSQRNKSEAELSALVQTINEQLQTAENRRIIGDLSAANGILTQAEESARQVMDNESGLFRVEALTLLDTIRAKKEEINNIYRVSPRVVANLATKNSDIVAKGLIGLRDGEFVAYDAQSLYRVLLNTVDDPNRLTDSDELIIGGTNFPRFNVLEFLVTGDQVVEWNNGAAVTMKTDDPAGWAAGTALETYLNYLYILAPDRAGPVGKNQIYKYERLTNRFSSPVPYNVNGDLLHAIDLTIDGNVYVLKEGGTILKLFRGEEQPFQIRQAPDNLLVNATKIFKVTDGNFYLLDPVEGRVIVLSDGGSAGEATYLRQYVLEIDQLGELKDLYVDPDQAHLYVMNEKRIFIIDLNQQGERQSEPGA